MENSSGDRYSVIFDGQIAPNADLSDVKINLQKLFKTGGERIEHIFLDAPTPIQRHLSESKALRYKQVFEKTGARCRIVREGATVSDPSETAESVPPEKVVIEKPEPKVDQQLYQGIPQVYSPENFQSNEQHSRDLGATPAPSSMAIEREAWKHLGSGAAIAAVVLFFPFLSFVFRYINTLVHEIGHAFFGWIFGYPSVPAFDFMYGGGITMASVRHPMILLVIYCGFAFLLYFYRKNAMTLVTLVVFIALYTVVAFTDLHEIINIFMGHGMELVFASIFLYRALSGRSIVIDVERSLYAFLSFFIYFLDIRFAYRLISSAQFRIEYGAAKGGGHWMDFSRLALDYFHIPLKSVAAIFLFFCLLAPVLTYLFFRYRDYIFAFISRLIDPTPGK